MQTKYQRTMCLTVFVNEAINTDFKQYFRTYTILYLGNHVTVFPCYMENPSIIYIGKWHFCLWFSQILGHESFRNLTTSLHVQSSLHYWGRNYHNMSQQIYFDDWTKVLIWNYQKWRNLGGKNHPNFFNFCYGSFNKHSYYYVIS